MMWHKCIKFYSKGIMITHYLVFDNLVFKKIIFWVKIIFVFFPKQNKFREYFSRCFLKEKIAARGESPAIASVAKLQAFSCSLQLSGNFERSVVLETRRNSSKFVFWDT